jgi:hypothetical protein
MIRTHIPLLLLLTLPTACQKAPTQASPTPLPAWSYSVRMEALEREERRGSVRVPSESHRMLDSLVGTFRAHIRSWAAQGEQSQLSSGTTTNAWIAGGRFLRCELRGTMAGQPYERLSILGYDRERGCFVETRVDNSTTQMHEVGEGEVSENGREFVFERKWKDPGSDRPVNMREVLSVEDFDHHRWEQWSEGGSGRRFQTVEIRYERVR